MKGSEFIERVKRVSRDRGVEVVWDRVRGKSSHGTLYYGSMHRTIVRNTKDELKTGTLHGMLSQPGLAVDDLHRR